MHGALPFVYGHNEKGLRFVWAVCSHGQKEQEVFGHWNLSQLLLTLYMFE